MAVLKVVEILSESKESWEDATRRAVERTSKSVKNVRSVYVQNQNAVVKNGKISAFRVNLKVTFEVK